MEYLGNDVPESFSRDPFGRPAFHHLLPGELPGIEQPIPSRAYTNLLPEWNGGRIGSSFEEWVFDESPSEPNDWIPSTRDRYYDSETGDLSSVWTNEYTWTYSPSQPPYTDANIRTRRRSISESYYAADGKLMVQQINRDSLRFNAPTDSVFGAPWGVYEEYWYDALGRRVLKRSRQESPICTDSARCYSAIERYVWDGAQILWELRQANAGDTKDPNPTPSNGQTGHVGYVHAGGIDMPLGMIRNDTTLVLLQDHRGLYYAATTTAGAYAGGGAPWPSSTWNLSQEAFYPREAHAWLGSLPMGHLDHTGFIYKRNRYYDPASGQFTQADPIGFAGGLNLYGYANGDPVNFSDPFGLGVTVILKDDTHPCEEDAWLCDHSGGGGIGTGGGPGPGASGGRGGGSCSRLRTEQLRRKCEEQMAAYRASADPAALAFDRCLGASGQFVANLAVDAMLTYAWMSGLQLAGRGALLMAEGSAVRIGLIFTGTATTPAIWGQAASWSTSFTGRSMVLAGVGTVGTFSGAGLFPTHAIGFYDTLASTCWR